MTNILIWGIGGRLGRMVEECIAKTPNATCIGGVDSFADASKFNVKVFSSAAKIDIVPDVIIDFSRPEALDEILSFAINHNTPTVLATTGYSDHQLAKIDEASKKIAVFMTSNFSIGINLLIELCKKANAFLGEKFDIEIIEQHHNIKVDSPSGTALSIAKAINEDTDPAKEFVFGRHNKNHLREKKEIGIHAVRGGTVVGKHDVLFFGNDEILTISHEAQSKAVFAEGAIKAALFIADKAPKLYNMSDVLR